MKAVIENIEGYVDHLLRTERWLIAEALRSRADEMLSKMEYVAESELDRAADLIEKGGLS